MYHAITSRTKLSFLSHGPNSWPFLLYCTHYITIIFYFTYYFINWNRHIQCRNLPIGSSAKKDLQAYNPRASGTQSSISNMPSPRCQVPQPAHRDRSRGCTPAKLHASRFGLITRIHRYSRPWLRAFPARRDWRFLDRRY